MLTHRTRFLHFGWPYGHMSSGSGFGWPWPRFDFCFEIKQNASCFHVHACGSQTGKTESWVELKGNHVAWVTYRQATQTSRSRQGQEHMRLWRWPLVITSFLRRGPAAPMTLARTDGIYMYMIPSVLYMYITCTCTCNITCTTCEPRERERERERDRFDTFLRV
jgi:hypothetical protein